MALAVKCIYCMSAYNVSFVFGIKVGLISLMLYCGF